MSDLVPAGPDPLDRAKAIARTSLELAELEVQARELADEQEALDAERSMALVAQSASSLVEVETRLQRTRAVALRTRMALDETRQEMHALFDTQMQEALAARRPLEAKLKRLEEGLWTLSLYAGDEERIAQLTTTPCGGQREGGRGPPTIGLIMDDQLVSPSLVRRLRHPCGPQARR